MSIFFVYLLFVSYKNTPVVQDIGNITIDDFISEQPLISDENYVADELIEIEFNQDLKLDLEELKSTDVTPTPGSP